MSANGTLPDYYPFQAISIKEVFDRRTPVFKQQFFLVWGFGLFWSILFGLASIYYEWSGIPVHLGGIDTYITIYPPLIFCTLFTLWFGFFWGFIPAYIATFLLGLYSGMPIAPALFFGFADPLGLVILALAYRAVPVSIQPRRFFDALFFILISFIASLAGSVGSFVWTYANDLGIRGTFEIWQGWWLGGFVQNIFINMPLLLLLTPIVARWKQPHVINKRWRIPNTVELAGIFILVLSIVIVFVLLQNYFIAQTLIPLEQQLSGERLNLVRESIENTRFIVYIALALIVYCAILGYQISTQWASILDNAKRRAEKSSQYKSDFLATMSHEMRTPMNGVIATTSLLMDTPLNQEQKDYVVSVKDSGDSLLSIINDILDFSKIESGKMELERKVIHLRKAIEEVLNLMASKAAEKRLELYMLIEEEVPEQIMGDFNRLQQILLNLVGNALKFTQVGEVYIHVKKDNSSKVHHLVLLFEVIDTGVGIPENRIGKLFDSFSQADISVARQYGGTGLGLAICKRLLKLMHGEIWVTSVLGKGSTFSFTLPTEKVAVLPRAIPEYLKNKRVLLIGAHPLQLSALEDYCRQLGLHTQSCFITGLEQAATQALQLDLIMLDIPAAHDQASIQKQFSNLEGVSCPILCTIPWGKTSIYSKLNPGLNLHFIFKPIRKTKLHRSIRQLIENPKASLQEKANTKIFDDSLASRFPMKLLLAEDNFMNQKVAQKIFQKLGYTLHIVDNGHTAVEAAQKEQYDLIFMDVHMPELNGLEATEQIRKLPGISQPFIIAMTANAMEQDRQSCLQAGMNDFLSKPIGVDLLQQLLKKWGAIVLQQKAIN